MGALLLVVNFAYAKAVGSWWLVRVAGALVLVFMQAWEQYWDWLWLATVCGVAVTSLYVYDCCGNIS